LNAVREQAETALAEILDDEQVRELLRVEPPLLLPRWRSRRSSLQPERLRRLERVIT
jgi:hypothetical protein